MSQVVATGADPGGMRILERPLTIKCQAADCGVDVPVNTRGPIPQFCLEHRGGGNTKQPAKTITLPRREVEALRQAKADAIMLQKGAQDQLREMSAQLWRAKETLRDVRLELDAARARVRELEAVATGELGQPDTVSIEMQVIDWRPMTEDVDAFATDVERTISAVRSQYRDAETSAEVLRSEDDVPNEGATDDVPPPPMEVVEETPTASAGTLPPPVPVEAVASIESSPNFADFTPSVPEDSHPDSASTHPTRGPMTGFE